MAAKPAESVEEVSNTKEDAPRATSSSITATTAAGTAEVVKEVAKEIRGPSKTAEKMAWNAPPRSPVLRIVAGFVISLALSVALFYHRPGGGGDWWLWSSSVLFGISTGTGIGSSPTPSSDAPKTVATEHEILGVGGAVSHCSGYEAFNVVESVDGLTADLRLAGPACNVYGEDIVDLKLLVEYQTDKRLHVKIYDAGQDVYQIQEAVLPSPEHKGMTSSESAVRFSVIEKPFSFAVTRASSGEELFNTSRTPLVFESQFVRLRTSLPDDPNLYGLGAHHDEFRLQTTGYRRTLWNTDAAFLPPRLNSYGSHPIYFDHRDLHGETHGVFLRNANGMEVNIHNTLDDGQYLEYVLLGGVLDFYFLAGPTPTETSRQYAEVVGLPAMHPYWALGVHQCKYGYWDVNMLAEVVANYSTAGIPLDVLWSDIDSMDDRRDFTLDSVHFPMRKMRLLIDTLHRRGQKFVTMVDAGVPRIDGFPPFVRGDEKGVFLKAADGSNHLGVQWPGVVVWPDWLAPDTQGWWTDEIVRWFDPETGMDVDGLWNDMNEASNFCPDATCDPVEFASRPRSMPPPKHKPRSNTGRPIPGFPPEFQPPAGGGEVIQSPSSPSSSANVIASQEEASSTSPLAPPSSSSNPGEEETSSHDSSTDHHQEELKRRSSSSSTSSFSNPTSQQHASVVGGQMKGLPGRNLLHPPYRIQNYRGPTLSGHTIFTNITNSDGTVQHDTHNLWGTQMALSTRHALISRRPTLRPFVLTRSTFPGAGSAAAHWFGDNLSTWAHLRLSIYQMLSATTTQQIPLVGSDVCGFNGATSPQLCARWTTAAAFQPFFRNHADLYTPRQEFYVWPETTAAARRAITARYRLLDFMYTALERQTRTGEPMVSPLWFGWPGDKRAARVQTQWLLGEALMVSPVVEEGRDEVDAYVPEGRWFDFWTMKPLLLPDADADEALAAGGRTVTFRDVGLDEIPVHIRGGYVVPLRATGGANTTVQLREEDFVLVVAPGVDSKARGQLYLDDGESLDVGDHASWIEFEWDGTSFSATAEDGWGYKATVEVESVMILGQRSNLGIRGAAFDTDTGVLTVRGPWSLREPFGFTVPSAPKE